MKSKFFGILVPVSLCFMVISGIHGCGHRKWTREINFDAPKYLACNVWVEDGEIWSAGYQAGRLIPAGTRVANIKLGRAWHYQVVGFTVADNSRDYFVYFKPKHHPDITVREYMDRLFTSRNFSEMTMGMTDRELRAIKSGDVIPGMTKEAVLISWGYPPEIGTGSIDLARWKFWKTRFDTVVVRFDEYGMVYEIQD